MIEWLVYNGKLAEYTANIGHPTYTTLQQLNYFYL